MNKLNQLLIGGTAMVSMLGWNINMAQAQSLPAYCTGSAIGALLGLAIGANPSAAANAIPAECTTQNQNSPSSSPKLIAAYNSTKSDSDVGIKQDCISFFYDSGDFLEKCSSFINSGYTRPRTRITNIEGIWKRTGDLVYVKVRSSAGLSGERKYQIIPDGLLNLDTGTRLTKE